MKAANSIRVVHYAEIDPKYKNKQILTLCGHRLPIKDTTADIDKVSCFMCWERLQAASQTI